MITLEALKSFGADTEKGLAMCMGNEALYLRLAGSVPGEERFDALSDAIKKGDLDAAFDAAGRLCGALSPARRQRVLWQRKQSKTAIVFAIR